MPAVGRPTQVSGPGPTVGLRLPRLTVHISLDSLHLRLWQGVLAGCLTGPCPGAPSRGYVRSSCGLGPGKAPWSGAAKARESEFGVLGPTNAMDRLAPGGGGECKRNSEGKTVLRAPTLSLGGNLPALPRTRRSALRSPGAPSPLQRSGSFSYLTPKCLEPETLDPWLDSAYRDSVPDFAVKGGEAEGKGNETGFSVAPKVGRRAQSSKADLSQTSPSAAAIA